MHRLIDRIVCVIHPLDRREGIIEIRLLEPLPMPVNVMQALVGIDRDEVGRYADMRPVLFMQPVKPQIPVSL